MVPVARISTGQRRARRRRDDGVRARGGERISAFVIFHLTVKDPDAFRHYAQAVGPTLPPYGGAVALRGQRAKVLDGEHDDAVVGVLRFPNREAAAAWYASAEYQALIPGRDTAARATVIAYDAL